nr:MAG TPA: Regulator of polyketide synthase expression [Caudoviricetes sp.]
MFRFCKKTKLNAYCFYAFIHVNSVKYRLQQIYNILPIQLNTSYDWLQIQLAAILYRYLLNNK